MAHLDSRVRRHIVCVSFREALSDIPFPPLDGWPVGGPLTMPCKNSIRQGLIVSLLDSSRTRNMVVLHSHSSSIELTDDDYSGGNDKDKGEPGVVLVVPKRDIDFPATTDLIIYLLPLFPRRRRRQSPPAPLGYNSE